MKIGIIGVGVTGGTLERWLREHTKHEVICYDPPKGMNGDISRADRVFICVPVPTLSDGTQSYQILLDSIGLSPNVPIFVRSTVVPSFFHWYFLEFKGKSVFHVPEFLTERRSYEDMCRQDIICSENALGYLREIFTGKNLISQKTEGDCALVKYAHNCFGAMKINFFNHIFKMATDYDRVRDGFLSTGYINEEHTLAPGPDGHFGYGGNCFLKDMIAFAKWSGISSLNETHHENLSHRKFIIKESLNDYR